MFFIYVCTYVCIYMFIYIHMCVFIPLLFQWYFFLDFRAGKSEMEQLYWSLAYKTCLIFIVLFLKGPVEFLDSNELLVVTLNSTSSGTLFSSMSYIAQRNKAIMQNSMVWNRSKEKIQLKHMQWGENMGV